MTRKMAPKLHRLTAHLAARYPHLPIKETVKVLVENYEGQGTWYSPSQLAEGLPAINHDVLLRVLELLSDEPYGVLEVKWTVIGKLRTHDPAEDDDNELFPVSPHAALLALKDGALEHPYTGELIEARGRVHLHYEPKFPLVVTR